MSKCYALAAAGLGIRNACMCLCERSMHGRRPLERDDLGRRWIELEVLGLEENGAGPSGSGGGERGVFNHRSRGQVRKYNARTRRGPLEREDVHNLFYV